MKKELLIYLSILILSALVLHPDLLTDPLKRIDMMSERANYYHPVLFSLAIYLVVGFGRLIVAGIKKLTSR